MSNIKANTVGINKKSKVRKKVKYTKLSISISLADKKAYSAYCKRQNVSLKRLIKKILKDYMQESTEKVELSSNQLDLFAPPSPIQAQLSLFPD